MDIVGIVQEIMASHTLTRFDTVLRNRPRENKNKKNRIWKKGEGKGLHRFIINSSGGRGGIVKVNFDNVKSRDHPVHPKLLSIPPPPRSQDPKLLTIGPGSAPRIAKSWPNLEENQRL